MSATITKAKNTKMRKDPHAAKIDKGILLLFSAAMAWYYHGETALKLTVFSVITAVIADLLCAFLLKLIYHTEKLPTDLLSGIFSGSCVALLMPADIPTAIPVCFIFIGIVFARLIYPLLTKKPTIVTSDGLSSELTALALISLLFARYAFAYPTPHAAAGAASPEITESTLQILSENNTAAIVKLGHINILTGNVAGPMGATCFLLMLAGFCYLLLRRPKTAVMPAGYMLAVVLFAVIFRRGGLSLAESILFEMSGGMAFFIAVFILSEPKYQPKNIVLAASFGLFAGILTMLLRYIGFPQDGSAIAALAVNLASVLINRSALFKKPQKDVRGKRKFMTQADKDAYIDEIGTVSDDFIQTIPEFKRKNNNGEHNEY